MKYFICVLFISFSSIAADYNCRSGRIKLVLDLDANMTTLLVQDIQSHEYYYNGVVSQIIKDEFRTDLMFETRSNTFLQLQFKTTELDQTSDRLFGLIRGWYGAGFIDSSIQCMKNTTSI